jgi:hypothetical protein
VDQPHTRLSLDGGKEWQRPWRSSQGRSPGRWNSPEGGDPLGRDLDGEQRSLDWDPESERGFLPNARGTCARLGNGFGLPGRGTGKLPGRQSKQELRRKYVRRFGLLKSIRIQTARFEGVRTPTLQYILSG